MWSISDLKNRAWNVLRANYWKSFVIALVVTLIIVLVDGALDAVQAAVDFFLGISTAAASGLYGFLTNYVLDTPLMKFTMLPAFSLIWVVSMALSIFFAVASTVLVATPAEVGLNRYFMRARQGYTGSDSVLFPLQNRFGNVLKVGFFKYLYNFLWSLLFIIPGIVKYYEYYMIPYILSENPGISKERAFAISRAMTDGEKWNIFVLELSFIGWHLLAILTCGIGEFFLVPYIYATQAELYAAMRDKVFYLGKATPEDLPGYPGDFGNGGYQGPRGPEF